MHTIILKVFFACIVLRLVWAFMVRIVRGYLLFEVNTKYISSGVFKTSEFSRVRGTSGNLDVLNSRDNIYLVFIKRQSKFSFYFIL